MARKKQSKRSRRTSLYMTLIVVGANICGVALVTFYFSNVQINTSQSQTFDLGIGLGVTVALTAGLLALGNFLAGRYMQPLQDWYHHAEYDGEPRVASLKIQRIALNLPLVSTTVNMAMWLLAGLVFGVLNGIELDPFRIDWGLLIQVALGIEIAGFVVAVLIYFAVERVWRSELPLFFVEGDLPKTPAFRLTVRGRLLILFLMGVMPLVDLAALSYSQFVQIVSAPDPAAQLPRLLLLELFFVGVGILTAVALARTLGASLVEPLEALTRRMAVVQEGNLGERVAVTSNDEIGILATQFNYMIDSLQRRDVELRTIYQVSQDITANLELEQTVCAVLEQVGQIVPYDGAEVCLYDEKERVLHVQARALVGQILADPQGHVYRLGEGYTGWMGEHRQGLLIPDVDACHVPQPVTRVVADGVTLNSYLGVPLLMGQQLVGTLELVSVRKGAFDEHARQLLETIAPPATIAIQNAAEVLERERRLREQIAQLRIEVDEAKKARQVAEITETEYFQNLQQRAREMRGEAGGTVEG